MKFRTEIPVRALPFEIGYRNRILSLGSCFAESIAGRLAAAKFAVTLHPTGILFNPRSIASALRRFETGRAVETGELHESGGLWFHYGFHGSFSGTDPQQTLAAMNRALAEGCRALAEADRLLVTFGTAWIYELRSSGETVANCHRQPREQFLRRRLSAAEIVAEWEALLEGSLAGKKVLFTLSPVRHVGDGAEENSLSKATLRVAIAELAERHPDVGYFPAFELLTDDLRDYRFYADDLVHPSRQAEQYIWEHFVQAALDREARRWLPEIEAALRALQHRPLHPGSEAWANFRIRQRIRLKELQRLSGADLKEEIAYFG